MNRREFLKSSGVMIASVALLPTLPDDIGPDKNSRLKFVELRNAYIETGNLVDLILIDHDGNEYTAQLPALQSTVNDSFADRFVEFKLLLSEVKQRFSFCKTIIKRQGVVLLEEQIPRAITLAPGDSLEITVNSRWDHIYEPA